MDKKCGPGEILRRGYRRKGYLRKAFDRDGTRVPSTFVSPADVPPHCIPDQGKPGKGPETLPPVGTEISLTRYGYGIHKSEAERRKALRAASDDYNTLRILRRLNSIRNRQTVPENKERFSDDVAYLSNLYKREKKQQQKGGNEQFSPTSEEQEDMYGGEESMGEIHVRESPTQTKLISEKEEDMYGGEESMGEIHVSESPTQTELTSDAPHVVETQRQTEKKSKIFIDGKEAPPLVVLTEADADAVIALGGLIHDKEKLLNAIREKTFIGLKVNNQLVAYAEVANVSPSFWSIDKFDKFKLVALFFYKKGYGTIFYTLLERYLKEQGDKKVVVIIPLLELEERNALDLMNFWYKMGLVAQGLDKDKMLLFMAKNL